MADTVSELNNYNLQLQQVEAALTNEPDNEELLKLKTDLQEVINLTQELVSTQGTDAPKASSSTATDKQTPDFILPDWKVGDRCSAPWSRDQEYYNAVIVEILDDGRVTITFEYGNTEVSQVAFLKKATGGQKRKGEMGDSVRKTRDQSIAEREYKKKKAQKKKVRMQQLVQEKEEEKNKWKQFNVKTFSKTSKGRVKKSIFATPDTDSGKVGVGTCGVGGKGLTKFDKRHKWTK